MIIGLFAASYKLIVFSSIRYKFSATYTIKKCFSISRFSLSRALVDSAYPGGATKQSFDPAD